MRGHLMKRGLALILSGSVIFVICFLVYLRFGFGSLIIQQLFIGSILISGILILVGFIILLSWYKSKR